MIGTHNLPPTPEELAMLKECRRPTRPQRFARNIDELLSTAKDMPPFTPYTDVGGGRWAKAYWKGDPDYGEQVNEFLVLYRSIETKEVVGCRIAL